MNKRKAVQCWCWYMAWVLGLYIVGCVTEVSSKWIVEYWQILWYSFFWDDARSVGNWFPTFRVNVIVSSSTFRHLKMRPLNCLETLGASYFHIIWVRCLLSSLVYYVRFSRSKIETCGFSNITRALLIFPRLKLSWLAHNIPACFPQVISRKCFEHPQHWPAS